MGTDRVQLQANGVDICLIEDDPQQRDLLVTQLRQHGFSVVEADCGKRGLGLIYEHHPRVVISDIVMPDLSGMDVCRQVRADESLDGTYVILVTAYHKATLRRRALRAGADDYIVKPVDIEELVARIANGLRLSRLQDRLREAALTDSLTGLWNHTQFREMLDREYQRTRRYGGCVSLLLVDLDHFKAVNDTFGHEVGNVVLQRTARHLQETGREVDLVARYGGEEFAIICPETSLPEATALAERIRVGFPEAVRPNSHPQLYATASIGVACSQDVRVSSVADLINFCDQALYRSKRQGRDSVTTIEMLDDDVAPDEVLTDEVNRLRKEVVSLSMRSKELCLQSVWALIQALEARDPYSAWHSRNVTVYTNWLALAAGWSESLRITATNAAMLHDLGKIGISDDLLLKAGKLSADEASTLRQIPLITGKILEPLRVFEPEILLIRHMRERYDGAGYPDRLVGTSIPLGSRLIAITEAFDSMTCDRAYRPARPIRDALRELRAEAGAQFDPELVELLGLSVSADVHRWQQQIDRARKHQPVPHLALRRD